MIFELRSSQFNYLMPLLVFLIILNDYGQYSTDFYGYILILSFVFLSLLFFTKNFYIPIFFIILISSERSRFFYDEVNFNSILLGPLKYLIFFILFIIFIFYSKGKLKPPVFFALCLFFISLTFGLLLNDASFFWMISDLTQFCYYFIFPFITYMFLSYRTSTKLLDFFNTFTLAFPIAILTLILIGRYNFVLGAMYVVYSAILLLNTAYTAGRMMHGDLSIVSILALLLNLFCMILAPSSAQAIFLLGTAILSIFFLSKKKHYENLFKISFIFLILISILLFVVQSFYPDIFGALSFLNHKINQVISLVSGANLYELPFSVQVRAIEYINVFFHQDILVHIFGRGFGGYFSDDILPFSNLNTTAFALEEISAGRFHDTHSFLSNIYFHYGLIGITFYAYFLVWISRQLLVHNKWFVPILFMGLFISFWGIQTNLVMGLLIGAFLRISQIKNIESFNFKKLEVAQ